MEIHNFEKCNIFSKQCQDIFEAKGLHKKIISKFLKFDIITDKDRRQKLGCDALAHEQWLEYKFRDPKNAEYSHRDILLEYEHIYHNGYKIDGWIHKYLDNVLFVYVWTKLVQGKLQFKFPILIFRMSELKHFFNKYNKDLKIINAKNKDYTSYCKIAPLYLLKSKGVHVYQINEKDLVNKNNYELFKFIN